MPGAAILQTVANRAVIGGTEGPGEYVAFAGCNYLGLAHDPRVLEAVREATGRFGLSSSASRETSGNTPAHEELEARVTAYVGGAGPASAGIIGGVLVPDGYTANLAAAQGLVATHPTAVIDRRAHASIPDAARCAGMSISYYAHGDAADAARVLGETSGPAVVMTDGVFTSHGGVAPIVRLLEALRPGDRLLVDDCHGLGVLGNGRGSCVHTGVEQGEDPTRLVYTSTLAKGMGGGGGIVIADAALVEAMRLGAHAYVCTTPVSPLVAAGTLRALEILESEPERVARLITNARALRAAMGDSGPETPICARPVESRAEGERIVQRLRAAGLFVPLMAYPGGPTPWYFRASVTSEHSAEEIGRLAEFFGS